MDTANRIFLIYGSNYLGFKRAIEGLKKRLSCVGRDALNSIVFYAKELEISDLSNVLLSVSFSKDRIVIFKDFDFLNGDCRNFIFKNINKIIEGNCLVFQTDRDYYQLQKNRKFSGDDLFSFLIKKSASIKIGFEKKPLSVEDFIITARKRDLSSCLYCVESLFKDSSKAKILGPQLMGILISQIAYHRDSTRKSVDFTNLWEADRLMKEKGVNSRLVIETLLTKLFG